MERIVNSAAPKQMNILVRRPAGRCLNWRSSPMMPPRTAATNSRRSVSEIGPERRGRSDEKECSMEQKLPDCSIYFKARCDRSRLWVPLECQLWQQRAARAETGGPHSQPRLDQLRQHNQRPWPDHSIRLPMRDGSLPTTRGEKEC